MPPMPKTATVSPGETLAVLTAEPQPVGTPQPTSTALSSGRSSSTLTAEFWWITPYWLKVPRMHMAPYWPRGPVNGKMLAGQVALQDRSAPVADRLAPGGAVAADAAVRDEGADDVVTGLHPGHTRPHLLDDPRALMAKHHRQACLEVP